VMQERTLCAMLFRNVTKSIAHKVRSYRPAAVVVGATSVAMLLFWSLGARASRLKPLPQVRDSRVMQERTLCAMLFVT